MKRSFPRSKIRGIVKRAKPAYKCGKNIDLLVKYIVKLPGPCYLGLSRSTQVLQRLIAYTLSYLYSHATVELVGLEVLRQAILMAAWKDKTR
ncbi:hypothetical protein HOLleu_23372 [Holothuria leucospilota]|uniref:Uncharacterized protein n=1 Tax=Holothuria leucospilota TaxID=206669 RepID=A0A9Q1H563_HOLLE|nr:hypothetical protein HOLleu_23372 [Holothuria leucospilota]